VKQVQPDPPLHGVMLPLPSTTLQSMLQESLFCVQPWPSFAQFGALPEPVPPQVPVVMPVWKMHVVPLQQSALLVQVPPMSTQVPLPQWKLPLPSGTHGEPSQQSPENAQAEPVIWQPEPRP
jgi:hypothetical protein